jgi:hypothetical protein
MLFLSVLLWLAPTGVAATELAPVALTGTDW